jgi:hypothetical protein
VPKSKPTLNTAFQMCASFPRVEQSTAYGKPALKVRGPKGKLEIMACVPTHSSAEPGSLMVRVDRRDRAALLEEAPHLYYAPDHYLNYDAVLIRVTRFTPELLRDLLTTSYNFVTRKRTRREGTTGF